MGYKSEEGARGGEWGWRGGWVARQNQMFLSVQLAACLLEEKNKNKIWAPRRRSEKRALGPRRDPGSAGCTRGAELFGLEVREGVGLVSVLRTLRVIRLLTPSHIAFLAFAYQPHISCSVQLLFP